jgi:hypothetical protein
MIWQHVWRFRDEFGDPRGLRGGDGEGVADDVIGGDGDDALANVVRSVMGFLRQAVRALWTQRLHEAPAGFDLRPLLTRTELAQSATLPHRHRRVGLDVGLGGFSYCENVSYRFCLT